MVFPRKAGPQGMGGLAAEYSNAGSRQRIDRARCPFWPKGQFAGKVRGVAKASGCRVEAAELECEADRAAL
jgi:hypothetical protein